MIPQCQQQHAAAREQPCAEGRGSCIRIASASALASSEGAMAGWLMQHKPAGAGAACQAG